ncbi:MAG: peptide ABC transporter substrate-binding protein [Chloroflexi bacterium]|nr:peptide ABC transporter substrate-binding protein [Chloroflexota bacterium]
MKGRLRFAILVLLFATTLAACGPIPTTPPPTPIPRRTPTLEPVQPTATLIPTVVTPTNTPVPFKVLRIGHVGYPDILDPQKAAYWPEIEVLRLTYDGLLNVDEKGNITASGAETWEFSKQGNVLTFRIRSGMKRSDGTPITAKDYEYALQREIDPRVPDRYYSSMLYDIKGAATLDNLNPKTVTAATVDKEFANFGVKAVDQTTLTVTLDSPVTFWNYVASTWVTYPADKRQVDKNPEDWWSRPEGHVGNGPFKIQSLERGKKIVLVPNEYYWRGKPKLDRIELIYYADSTALLEAYKQDQVDIAANLGSGDLAKIGDDPRLKSEQQRSPSAITAGLAFNVAKKPFNDLNVRKAFSAAMDRETFVREVMGNLGRPSTRWIPPGIPGAQGDKVGVPGYDPKAAVKYLVDNGYAAKDSTADKPKVDCAKLGEIKITYSASANNQKRVQSLVTSALAIFNCPITLEPVDPVAYKTLLADPKTTPQITFQAWMGDYPHPQNWLSLYWVCGAVSGRYGYCNKNFDQLIQEADREPDLTKSLQLYQQAEDLLLKDVPSILIGHYENLSLIKPYVAGLKDHAGSSDMQWPGEWGPVWTYDIDLTKVATTYPKY